MKKLFLALALVAMVFATGCHKEPQNGGENGGGNGNGGNNGGGDTPTETSYTVTFNANGGTGTMQTQTFTEGETKALTANAFTYEYHTFVNWKTEADGSGTAYADGQEITVTANMTLYAQWSNTVNGHEWVDLGLPSGTLWATCNVGATPSEEYGDWFAWGEIQPHAGNHYGSYNWSWSNYKYANGTSTDNPKLTKYCNNASYGNNGFTDTLIRLLPEDDAATANWGNGWRMPTKEEMEELINNCSLIWTTHNGIWGRLFIASNGNSLFLPAAVQNGGGYDQTYGRYWSSSLHTDYPNAAWFLGFYEHYSHGIDYRDRCYGYSVRPVCSVPQK